MEEEYKDNSRLSQLLRNMEKNGDTNLNAVKEYVDNKGTIKTSIPPEVMAKAMASFSNTYNKQPLEMIMENLSENEAKNLNNELDKIGLDPSSSTNTKFD